MIRAFFQSLLTLVFIALILVLTFGYQVWDKSTLPGPSKDSEAIIVLTGGSNRVEKGIELYELGFAPTLFISGTNPEITEETLLSHYNLDPCCVVLDPLPLNTHENALNTVKWAKEQGLAKLILITSNYHMPRALMEFKEVFPDGFISPVTVKPKGFSFLDSYSWKIFLKECMKYWSVRFAKVFNIGFNHVYNT